MSVLTDLIKAVHANELSFFKFLRPNEVGATGSHQSGILISKSANSIMFEGKSPNVKRERSAKILWHDGSITENHFKYYDSKNEFRITNFGKNFKFLRPDAVGNLFVLSMIDYDNYKGFFLSDEDEIDIFLKEFGLDRRNDNIIIPLQQGLLFTSDNLETVINNEPGLQIDAKFKPRARLLIQLGDQLIKNESIALVELIKNSYDADANNVNILMENVDSPINGSIIIEDDGYGMTADIVENVWLEPGSDFKSQKIQNLEVSPKYKRLPIGEKGIGRFGVHKLGNVIEMTTKANNSNEVYVKIDWTDFNDYKYLEDVPIKILVRDVPKMFKDNRTGTLINISNLRKTWERGIARDVKRSITALASPFENNDSFKPTFDILDKPFWFQGLLKWEDIKDYSLFRFKIEIEEDSIVKFDYEFTPWATMTKLLPQVVDESSKLLENSKRLKFKNENGKEEFYSLANHKIGKVIFEGYIFDLDAFVLKMGVSDKDGFKKYLKSNGGIKVFRDGLRIYDYGEPENDWLNLDFRRFQQPTKAVSNNLILGAVYLSRKDSSDLIEKTNREGFVENDAYKAFRSSVLQSLDLVEILRLSDKRKLKEFYGPTPKSAPLMSTLEEAKRYVLDKVEDLEIKEKIVKYLVKVESDYKQISENLLKAAGAGLSMSVVVHEVEKIIFEVEKVLKAENASERVIKLIEHLSSLIDGYAEIIRKSNQQNENLTEIIDQALFNTEYRLSAHKIEVIKEYKNFKGNSRIKIAKNLLVGSFMNIIDNSIYWLDQRGFIANQKAETYSKKIYINIFEEEKFINLVIADNGTGFLIQTDDITEPFVTAKSGGMGLGLHIANEIMEAQKGRLFFPEYTDFELPKEFQNGAIIAFSLKK
jgi:hypothetical protein